MIDQKQMENVECFNYVGSMMNVARCTGEIKSRFAVAKSAFNNNNNNNNNNKIGLIFKGEKLVKCYLWSIALYRVVTWTLRKVD